MIGIQIVTHGSMSKSMIDSLEMIVGAQKQIAFNTLKPDVSFEAFCVEVLETTKELNDGSGVLVFVDLYGASPFKAAVLNSREFSDKEYSVIAGVNLPLLIEASILRTQMDIDELMKTLVDLKNDTIKSWRKEDLK